ncbi:MAG: hypothetical protein ACM3UU_06745 [Ignavibacteriales bacterium]
MSKETLGESSIPEKLCAPLDGMTIELIKEIDKIVITDLTNHGHSMTFTFLTKKKQEPKSDFDLDYFSWLNSQELHRNELGEDSYDALVSVLSYIKFISSQLDNNYPKIFWMSEEFGVNISLEKYANVLISKINDIIMLKLSERKRPWPGDICEAIGKDICKMYDEETLWLYHIVDGFQLEAGLRIVPGHPDQYEEREKTPDIISQQTPKILKMYNTYLEAQK